jgi:hypothetical protein
MRDKKEEMKNTLRLAVVVVAGVLGALAPSFAGSPLYNTDGTKSVVFHASASLGGGSIPITSSDWQELGGVVTNPSAFYLNLPTLLGQVVGLVKAVGVGAEIRIVERNDAGVEIVMGQWAITPSADWVTTRYYTTVPPRAGDHLYRLDGKLGAATSVALRYPSLVLLESLAQ